MDDDGDDDEDMPEYIVQWLCGSVESVSCAEYFLYLDLSKF